MFRKWLVAVAAAAFLTGSIVGCEPKEEGGGPAPGTEAPTTAEKPDTADEAPATEAAPTTEAGN
jgi:hypothetical protein